jgi:hypothetical protein
MTPPTWPISPDWSRPWEETVIYPTDVIPATDGSEKRIALREEPARRVAFRCVAVDAVTAQTAAALVEANHVNRWTLPDWHTDASPGTSRTGRLVAFDALTVGRPMNYAAAFDVVFELDTVEGQA